MKDKEGRIVAVDFGGYSLRLALRRDGDFAQRISYLHEVPLSPNLEATESASFALVPYGRNEIGEQISLLLYFSCLLPS